MLLITPNPSMDNLSEASVRFLNTDSHYMLDHTISDVSKYTDEGIVYVWTLTQKVKTKTSVEIVNRYTVNARGEVLPA